MTTIKIIMDKYSGTPLIRTPRGQAKLSRIHVDLLEQLIDADNNPAIRTEAVGDSGKQRTS